MENNNKDKNKNKNNSSDSLVFGRWPQTKTKKNKKYGVVIQFSLPRSMGQKFGDLDKVPVSGRFPIPGLEFCRRNPEAPVLGEVFPVEESD